MKQAPNWLKQPREAAGLTQKALANAIGKDDKDHVLVSRWENCRHSPTEIILYAALGRVLKKDEIALIECHLGNLETLAGESRDESERKWRLAQQLQARAAIARARSARHFGPIDPSSICDGLAQCDGSGLSAFIAKRREAPADAPAQAGLIARRLEERDFDGVRKLLNEPLRQAIERAATSQARDALKLFLGAVIRACAAQDPGLDADGLRRHRGRASRWAIRAMIHASLDLDGIGPVELADSAGSRAPAAPWWVRETPSRRRMQSS